MIRLETFLFIFSTQGLLNVKGIKMQVKIGANWRLFSDFGEEATGEVLEVEPASAC